MPQDLGTGSIPGSNYFLYWRQVTGAKAARVSPVSCIATFDKTGLLKPGELHQVSLPGILRHIKGVTFKFNHILTPFFCNPAIPVSVNFVNFSLGFICGT